MTQIGLANAINDYLLINNYKFVYVGVQFLALNVLLHFKSEEKGIGNQFLYAYNCLKSAKRNILLLQLASGAFGL